MNRGAALLILMLMGVGVLAQYRVDTRVAGGNPPVNRNLYSSSAMGGLSGTSVRYAGARQTSVAMDSELRYEYRRVGALPSDIRMGQNAVGPLSPSGPQAYIPPKPNYAQRANLAPPPPPPSLSPSTYAARESIRYSGKSKPTTSANAVRAQSAAKPVAPQQVSGALRSPTINNAAPSGSVRYSK